MTRVIRVLAAVGLAVLATGVVGALAPSAAAAARADIVLTVSGDGAGGVTVLASYAADGRPFEQPLPLILTGTGDGGRTVGPLQLKPTPEGRGFYSAAGILAPGTWQIVVTANDPQPLRAEAMILAQPQQTAVPPEEMVTLPSSGGLPSWLWIVAVPVVAVLAAGGFLLWRLRRSRSPSSR